TATCKTIYGQQVTAQIKLTPTAPELEVYPTEVYAGYESVLRADGCYGGSCKESAEVTWKNLDNGETYTGSQIRVKVVKKTAFEVSCNGSEPRRVTVDVKMMDCDHFNYSAYPKGNSNYAEINASWCDSRYPINWFKETAVYREGRYVLATSEYTQGRNRQQIAVSRPSETSPPTGFIDTYTVACVRQGTEYPCNYFFMVESKYLYEEARRRPDLT